MTGRQTGTALVTLAILLAAFLGYEQSLGRLTDYDAIEPALLKPIAEAGEDAAPVGRREIEIALERAFEPAVVADLVTYPIALDWPVVDESAGNGRGLFVFTRKYRVQEDNPRVLVFEPFALVQVVGDPGADPKKDEVNSLHAGRATIEFEKPVEFFNLSKNRPIGGWLEGDIKLRNNQRSPDPKEGYLVRTERLDFHREKSLIWTELPLAVLGPDGTTIDGVGMELQLHPLDKREQKKPKTKSPARKLRLLKDANFKLIAEGGGDMLGGPAPVVSGAAKARPPDKAPLVVHAAGGDPLAGEWAFEFDFEKDFAEFRNRILVSRRPTGAEADDRLRCDYLKLEFQERKGAPAATKEAPRSVRSSKQLARATALGDAAKGTGVSLSSAAQRLHAEGDYLHFDAAAGTTTLKHGQEIVVQQENVYIHGRSLVLRQDPGENGKPGQIRQAEILAPKNGRGRLEVVEKGLANPRKELNVEFFDRLRLDPEPGGKRRKVTIVGRFELSMPIQGLDMTGDGLVVKTDEVETIHEGKRQIRSEPVWLQATGNVTANSRELSLTAGQKLTMFIEHAIAPAASLPVLKPANSDRAWTRAQAPALAPPVGPARPPAASPSAARRRSPRSPA